MAKREEIIFFLESDQSSIVEIHRIIYLYLLHGRAWNYDTTGMAAGLPF